MICYHLYVLIARYICKHRRYPGWDLWTQCPEDQVATGVRAYYYQDKYLTGLEISCQSVASRSIAKPSAKDKAG